MPENFDDKMRSINVSAANDNCFFHAYAAHLLAGSQPLPHDLFTFNSILGAESPSSRLQQKFPNQDSLSLFTDYQQIRGQDLPDDQYIVEKTLVLGPIMREWFATHLYQQDAIREQKENGFLTLIEYAQQGVLAKEELFASESGPLYQANQAFIEYCTTRGSRNELTAQEQLFEANYFNKHPGNDMDAFKAYWKDAGYLNYCQQLAQPKTKIAPDEVLPVLGNQGQHVSVLGKDGTVLNQNTVHTPAVDSIPMTLILGAEEGHYYLVPDKDKTAAGLAVYEQNYKQYLVDRAAILSMPGHDLHAKIAAAEQNSSLLIGAICTVEGADPLAELLGHVEVMQKDLAQNKRFESMCSVAEFTINQILTENNKKDLVQNYHAQIEPLLNKMIGYPETQHKQRVILQEYKHAFSAIEHELQQISVQEEQGLRTRLEFKLHELLDYSERLDLVARKSYGRHAPLANTDFAAEIKNTRAVIHQLCEILSHPQFDVKNATILLQEMPKLEGTKEYKRRYNEVIGDSRSCSEEARNEGDVVPPLRTPR